MKIIIKTDFCDKFVTYKDVAEWEFIDNKNSTFLMIRNEVSIKYINAAHILNFVKIN